MRIVFAFALSLSAAACSNSNSSSTTAPTTTAATTDTFTGTVAVGGSDAHPFTIAQTGDVDVTLTAAGPPDTIVMGLAIGTFAADGSTCTPLAGGSTSTGAGLGAQLTGVVSPGTLCVRVYDIGNEINPITYTVTVAHH